MTEVTHLLNRVFGNGVGMGAIMALSAGTVGYLQNRFGVVEWAKQLDSTYFASTFKSGLVLGAPVLGIELCAMTVEVLTLDPLEDRTTLEELRKHLAFKVVMTAVKTFVFVKGAEALMARGYPFHRAFIYQIAFIYACKSLKHSPLGIDLPLTGAYSLLIGALVVAEIALERFIRFEKLLQKLNLNYFTPSYRDAFVWGISFTFLGSTTKSVCTSIAKQATGQEKLDDKMSKLFDLVVDCSAMYGAAVLLNRTGFIIPDIYLPLGMAVFRSIQIKGIVSKKTQEDS